MLRQPVHAAFVASSTVETALMKHLPALDGLRAFAILIVATSHIVTSVIPGGFGVTLFFFISGFIITRMMLEQDFSAASLRGFYVRRFFRLAPALFVFIAISGLAMSLLARPIPASDYLATLFYYANYHHFALSDGINSPLGITWSLAVEEHFYFVFPVLFICARKNLAAWLIGVIVAVCLWRFVLVYGLQAPIPRTYFATDTRIDSIAWGCLLSAMIHKRDPLLDRIGGMPARLCGVGLLLVTFIVRDNGFRETIRYSLQGLALMPFFCHLFWAPRSPGFIRAALESRPARFIGNISYSLYLYHFLALSMAQSLFAEALEVKLFAIGCGLIAATLSYYFIENPVRRFGSDLARSIDRRQPAG